MATRIDRIDIQCPPEALYYYVTQPGSWHEWHPDSKYAHAAVETLRVGDRFEESIELQPLPPMPFRLRRTIVYRVLVAEPVRAWEVKGEAKDGWLRIRYEIRARAGSTRITRKLEYRMHGLSRLLMPFLKRSVARRSVAALENLKDRLERESEPVTS